MFLHEQVSRHWIFKNDVEPLGYRNWKNQGDKAEKKDSSDDGETVFKKEWLGSPPSLTKD